MILAPFAFAALGCQNQDLTPTMTDTHFKGWAKPGPIPPGASSPPDIPAEETLDAISGHFRLFQLRDGHRFSTDDVLTAWYGTTWAPRASMSCRSCGRPVLAGGSTDQIGRSSASSNAIHLRSPGQYAETPMPSDRSSMCSASDRPITAAFVMEYSPATIGMRPAIDEVLTLVRGELLKHQVSLQMRLADGLPLVHADRVQLQQIMLNLILNAIEAIISHGDDRRELVISTECTAGDNLLVAVQDSGPGVAPENRERIFESFYTTKAGGVGIGLSICRSIVDAHAGRLWVDAHAPRGAVFRFTMPAHR